MKIAFDGAEVRPDIAYSVDAADRRLSAPVATIRSDRADPPELRALHLDLRLDVRVLRA